MPSICKPIGGSRSIRNPGNSCIIHATSRQGYTRFSATILEDYHCPRHRSNRLSKSTSGLLDVHHMAVFALEFQTGGFEGYVLCVLHIRLAVSFLFQICLTSLAGLSDVSDCRTSDTSIRSARSATFQRDPSSRRYSLQGLQSGLCLHCRAISFAISSLQISDTHYTASPPDQFHQFAQTWPRSSSGRADRAAAIR